MAIILIVISHVVQTLWTSSPYVQDKEYVLDLSLATTNISYFILILFNCFGVLGNWIFFISSAWFLLHSSKCNSKKWFYMLIEIWVISVIILVATYIIRHGNISEKIIIKSILPTTFANNWYLTCYLLFYPIHSLLNMLINHMNKKFLFRISAVMFIIYCCFNFIKNGSFFSSFIILWITIYFVMAYIQLYMNDFANNKKRNSVLLLIGIIGFVGSAVLADILGLHISYLQNKMLLLATNYNPFLIMVAIALFNIMRNIHFKNVFVNYISSLSMLIYIIHENLILKTYYRTCMVRYVYETYGYNNIIFWVFIMAVFVFLFGVVCSVVYDKTIRRLVKSASNFLYSLTKKIYIYIESYVLKIH